MNKRENAEFVGKVLLHFDQLPSTNDYLRQTCSKSKPPEGLVVIADKQTAGRGQHGSKWFTGDGENLAMSMLLYPISTKTTRHFLLTQFFSLAVAETIQQFTEGEVKIKWPNDIYLNDKKLGGILIETTIQGNRFGACFFGLGLNVNQAHFPSNLPNPISLFQIKKQEIDKETLLKALFLSIEKRYVQLRLEQIDQIQAEYHENLFKRNQEQAFFDVKTSDTFWGKIQGVSENGQLVLELKNGEKRLFDLKNIQFLHEIQ